MRRQTVVLPCTTQAGRDLSHAAAHLDKNTDPNHPDAAPDGTLTTPFRLKIARHLRDASTRSKHATADSTDKENVYNGRAGSLASLVEELMHTQTKYVDQMLHYV